MGKRILKEQLIIAIILLLCGCSPIHFTENSHSQSVNTSSDRVVVSASDASTDNTLLEEETFSVKAQSAVEDFLSENQTPYRLGLFDLNEDGTPEVMVQNYIGQASKCIFYDLTDSEPAENYIRLNWPTICCRSNNFLSACRHSPSGMLIIHKNRSSISCLAHHRIVIC